VLACPAACLLQIPTYVDWPLNCRPHWWDFCLPLALKCKLLVATKILHLRKRETSELADCVEFLFHTVKYCDESISIRLMPFHSTFGDEGLKLCHDHDVNHLFRTCRTQRQKVRFRVQQSLLECWEGIA
jgi:hypothetical protein